MRHLDRRAGSRALLVAVALALVLGLSACGGGKKSTSTTDTSGSSATEMWATGVCTAFTTWKTSLLEIKSSIAGGGIAGLSSSELKQAERQAEDATKTLSKSLKDLGAPTTTGGEAAKSNLDALEHSLSVNVSTIKSVFSTNPSSVTEVAHAINIVQIQLKAMATSLDGAVADLKKFDASGELEKSFKNSPACAAYFNS